MSRPADMTETASASLFRNRLPLEYSAIVLFGRIRDCTWFSCEANSRSFGSAAGRGSGADDILRRQDPHRLGGDIPGADIRARAVDERQGFAGLEIEHIAARGVEACRRRIVGVQVRAGRICLQREQGQRRLIGFGSAQNIRDRRRIPSGCRGDERGIGRQRQIGRIGARHVHRIEIGDDRAPRPGTKFRRSPPALSPGRR